MPFWLRVYYPTDNLQWERMISAYISYGIKFGCHSILNRLTLEYQLQNSTKARYFLFSESSQINLIEKEPVMVKNGKNIGTILLNLCTWKQEFYCQVLFNIVEQIRLFEKRKKVN